MIEHMQIRGFKSWEDTGEFRLGRLTGFFGANSSGKSALLQFLLMMKQTVESADRSRVLETGGERDYTTIGSLFDVVYRHQLPGRIGIDLCWSPLEAVQIPDPDRDDKPHKVSHLEFETTVSVKQDGVTVAEFVYAFDYRGHKARIGMVQAASDPAEYHMRIEGYDLKPVRHNLAPLPLPVKSYGFPDRVMANYQDAGFLSELVLAFQRLFERTYYLGPLREVPEHAYIWSGERPQDVGRRGELAVPALIAARQKGTEVPLQVPMRFEDGESVLEERVAYWLKELDLIESFTLRELSGSRRAYEVLVRRSEHAPEVYLTDVGTGVSQVLPVLVLCYYVPEGSTILLEHPEVHLHPAVQTGLADVFIDAIKRRNVQIILESHSEYLLRRLQRRIAEEKLDAMDTALYFVKMVRGRSQLERLKIDPFGNIQNWPPDFFGDEMEDLVAQTEAEMERRKAEEGAMS